jgi:hypothetical protein
MFALGTTRGRRVLSFGSCPAFALKSFCRQKLGIRCTILIIGVVKWLPLHPLYAIEAHDSAHDHVAHFIIVADSSSGASDDNQLRLDLRDDLLPDILIREGFTPLQWLSCVL